MSLTYQNNTTKYARTPEQYHPDAHDHTRLHYLHQPFGAVMAASTAKWSKITPIQSV